jgi:hypothetical protein
VGGAPVRTHVRDREVGDAHLAVGGVETLAVDLELLVLALGVPRHTSRYSPEAALNSSEGSNASKLRSSSGPMCEMRVCCAVSGAPVPS